MNRVITTILAIAGLVSCASAFDPTGYDYLDRADVANETHSFNTAGNWHSGEKPQAGRSYYVTKQVFLPTTTEQATDGIVGGTYSFAGDRLVLGENANLFPRGAETDAVTINDLVMLDGSRVYYAGLFRFPRGNCTIQETSAEKPALLSSGMALNKSEQRGPIFMASLSGDADQYLATENTKVAEGRFHRYGLVGSQENYYGHYVITAKTFVHIPSTPGTIIVEADGEYGNFSTPDNSQWYVNNDPVIGAMTVKTGGKILLTKGCTLTVGDLTLENGALIELQSDGTSHARIKVTGTLTVTGSVSVTLGNRTYDTATGTPQAYEFLILGPDATTTADPSQFNLSSPTVTNPMGTLPHVYKTVVEGGDGTRTWVETRREIVKLQSGFNSCDEADRSALTSAMLPGDTRYYWSNHLAPQSGLDYLCTSMSVGIQPPSSAAPVVFAGESLTFANPPAGVFSFQSGSKGSLSGISFKQLSIQDDRFLIWDGVKGADDIRRFRICGGTMDLKGTALFRIFGGNVMVCVESDITGDGLLQVEGRKDSGSPNGMMELSGDNSAWTGKTLVTIESGYKEGRADPVCPSDNNYATLVVREGKNLGGPLAAFAKDALKVNQMCKVRAVGNVTFAAANRGVMVEGEARFEVDAGKTFAIGNQLTMAGVLRKEGAGTLALGGPMRFVDGEEGTAPLSMTNRIRLVAGSLKPLATNAFDGASILVENDSVKFLFDNEPTADGLQAYGLVDTKWENAVLRTGSATKINVELTADDDWYVDFAKAGNPLEIGLFTVKTAAVANRILGEVSVRTKYPKTRLALGVRENANGSYTVTGTLTPNGGMVLIFR